MDWSLTPLCIIPARMGSTRLPGKLLEDLGGTALIDWTLAPCIEAFGEENVVVAFCSRLEEEDQPLIGYCVDRGIQIRAADCEPWDLLARHASIAHGMRWHDDTVIVRATPDDPFRDASKLQATARGARHYMWEGGEATTLGVLLSLNTAVSKKDRRRREHLTHALKYPAPATELMYPGCTIDTLDDLMAARKIVAKVREGN